MGPVNFRTLYALVVSLSLLSVLCTADPVQDLITQCRPIMDAQIAKSQTCTKDKVRIRREWGDVSTSDKHAYIAAVQCLLKRPSQLDPNLYPGAKNRYDDFVAVHIKQTPHIHFTGNFLHWHRLYTTALEHALQSECGYNGTQPYWNWGRWATNVETSPLFDGSDTSIGGQGAYVPHPSNAYRPAGAGGGCITSGPFVDMQVNLGPIELADGQNTTTPNPRSDGMGYNPRCIKRDLTSYLTSRSATPDKIATLITNHTDIASFQNDMQAYGNLHPIGHFTVSGDPGSDMYVSPGELSFFFHHAMVDLVWSLWQCLDFENRQQVISGNRNWDGTGGSQTLEDVVDLDVVNIEGKTHKINELVSTVGGPFCYLYE